MASTLLTPSIIAKESLMQLDNNLVAAKMVYRDYESEFGETKIGDTLTIRKPVKYALRSGPVVQMQDAIEGKVQIQINKQFGVDLRFPSKDLTLTIDRFAERYLKHPMIVLANQVDSDVLGLYVNAWNWVSATGVYDPTKRLGSYRDFVAAPQRLDEMSVPIPRAAVISPNDFYGMSTSFTGLFIPDVAKTALEKAKLPAIGAVDCYSSQNTPVLSTVGIAGTPVVSSTAQTLFAVYDGSAQTVKDTNQFTLLTNGWDTSKNLVPGDVFTIAGVFAVNNITKKQLPYLQQFVIAAPVTTNSVSGNDTAITFSPAPLIAGPYQNVSVAPAPGAIITKIGGAAGGNFTQNLVFHENAFALCMVPMELPEGAVKKARQSYKGLSIRVICDYDITNDINLWRLDILYGVKAIYPDLACRLSGVS
jgi:hypothetical protein